MSYKIIHNESYYNIAYIASHYKVTHTDSYYKATLFVAAVGDTLSPELQTAAIDSTGLILTLTYNEALNESSTPATGDFSLSGTSSVINAVSVTGSTVLLGLDTAAFSGETVTLDYTAGVNPIQDLAGNNATNLTAEAVTNNSEVSALPTEGLIAEYIFSGNADDTSGNNYDGTTVNAPTLVADRFGNANSAYEFNGVDQRINLPPEVKLTGTFSINVWVNVDQLNGLDNVFGGRGYGSASSKGGISININESEISCNIYTSTDAYYFKKLINTIHFIGKWNLITFQYNGNDLELYINKVSQLADSHIQTNGSVVIDWGSYDALIGYGYRGYYDGIIDDFRLYNRALTELEITQLYEEGGYTP